MINDGAFWCNKITISVNLPNTIKTIGESAFGNCDKLTSITIPASIELLKQNAFWDCYSLERLTFIGKNITIDGYWTFGCCESLETIILPHICYIDDQFVGSTFYGCTNLKTVIIGEGTESLPSRFFYKCNKLRDVYIPASVNSINESTFGRESKDLILHCVEGSYAERFAIEYGYNYDCANSLILPNDLKIIENNAFEGTNCSIVIIPDGCSAIGENAFAGCTNLLYIRIPATVKYIPASAFEGCNENLVIDWISEE